MPNLYAIIVIIIAFNIIPNNLLAEEFDAPQNPTKSAYLKYTDGQIIKEEYVVRWGHPQNKEYLLGFKCSAEKNNYYLLSELVSVSEGFSYDGAANNFGYSYTLYHFKDNPEWGKVCHPVTFVNGSSFGKFLNEMPRAIRDHVSQKEVFKKDIPEARTQRQPNEGATSTKPFILIDFKWLDEDQLQRIFIEKKDKEDAKNNEFNKKLYSIAKDINQKEILLRAKLKVGDETNCGLVIEVKSPIAKIQTNVGEKWFKIDRLYTPNTISCLN